MSLTRNASFPACLIKCGDPHWAPLLDLLRQATGIYFAREACYELELMSLFFRIAAQLIQNMTKDEKKDSEASSDLAILKKMMYYVEQNLSGRLTLRAIAASGHICESKCCCLFRRYINCTPMGFVNGVRLERSCQLLESTGASVSEIAAWTGFGGSSYFAERFRAAYGMTPTAYRRRSVPPVP